MRAHPSEMHEERKYPYGGGREQKWHSFSYKPDLKRLCNTQGRSANNVETISCPDLFAVTMFYKENGSCHRPWSDFALQVKSYKMPLAEHSY